MKILSWNVNGMNSSYKRRTVFHFLQKQKCEIICLQESHIKQGEEKYIENGKLGKSYISANKKRKKGVVIYVKDQIESKEIYNDKKGYILGVEIKINNKKILLMGIYTPQGKKAKFFEDL